MDPRDPPNRDMYVESEAFMTARCRADKLFQLFMTHDDTVIYGHTLGLIAAPGTPGSDTGLLYAKYADRNQPPPRFLDGTLRTMARLQHEIQVAMADPLAYPRTHDLRTCCHAILITALLYEGAFFEYIAPFCQRADCLNQFVANVLRPTHEKLLVGDLVAGSPNDPMRGSSQIQSYVDICILRYVQSCWPDVDAPMPEYTVHMRTIRDS